MGNETSSNDSGEKLDTIRSHVLRTKATVQRDGCRPETRKKISVLVNAFAMKDYSRFIRFWSKSHRSVSEDVDNIPELFLVEFNSRRYCDL